MSTVPFRLLSFIEFQEAIGKILHFIKKTQVLLIFLMMALMADTQVCKKTVWHWKVKATQNFCSGEYNFAPTIEQGNGSNALKKNCGDEGSNIDSWPTYERRSRKRRGTHLKMTWGTTKIAGNEEAGRSLMDSYQRPGNEDSILCAHFLWLDLRQTNWYIEMESIELDQPATFWVEMMWNQCGGCRAIRLPARWFTWIAHLNHFFACVTGTALIRSITHSLPRSWDCLWIRCINIKFLPIVR